MFRKSITLLVFKTYDIFKKGNISGFYDAVAASDNKKGNRRHQVEAYTEYWSNRGFVFNDLVTKQKLIPVVEQVNSRQVFSWAYTGGSYGEPLRLPYSKKRAFLRTGTFKYYNEKGGYRLGDSFALIRAKNKSGLEKFLRNETIVIPTDVSEKKLEGIIETLSRKRVKVLMGYPTVMYELAMYLSARPELLSSLSVRHLISTSEMLEPEKREVVKNVFQASFVDRYANEEVGLIAQQEEFGGDYVLNNYNVITELLHPETLLPVKEGEIGKVVVTDIANELAPIIRYDTGDLAVAGNYVNGELKTLKRIIGRESEKIFDPFGNPVSSLALGPAIYKPLTYEPVLYQFQFAQTGKKNYELRLKSFADNIPEKLRTTILENLKQQLGDEAGIEIKKVADIVPQPSGKRPVYKNETIGCS